MVLFILLILGLLLIIHCYILILLFHHDFVLIKFLFIPSPLLISTYYLSETLSNHLGIFALCPDKAGTLGLPANLQKVSSTLLKLHKYTTCKRLSQNSNAGTLIPELNINNHNSKVIHFVIFVYFFHFCSTNGDTHLST